MTQPDPRKRYSVETDGITVWVNGHDGVCWGRFSTFGIDVHGNAEQQMSGTSCLECIPAIPIERGGPGKMQHSHWAQFQESMLRNHNATIPDTYMPNWL